jgi:hypothetical protein
MNLLLFLLFSRSNTCFFCSAERKIVDLLLLNICSIFRSFVLFCALFSAFSSFIKKEKENLSSVGPSPQLVSPGTIFSLGFWVYSMASTSSTCVTEDLADRTSRL